jgi:SHS2 domain-containing protein
MFQIVDHTADIAIQLEADDREGLFHIGLEAVIYLLTSDVAFDRSVNSQFSITASGFDDEELIIELINELLHTCQNKNWFPLSVISVKNRSDGSLVAVIRGISACFGYVLSREIKAATYHNLNITKNSNWKVKIVLDV